jgi:hypothetical protein
MMLVLKRRSSACVMLGALFFVLTSCKGESSSRNGSYCARITQNVIACGMEALLRESECDEPDTEESRCAGECFLGATCAELKTAVCEDDVPVELEACIEGCRPPPFTCGDGTQVSDFSVCDGYPDCADGSDEVTNCPKCGDGRAYPNYARCDAISECADGSDERGCVTFTCSNGETVPEDFECDGYPDCADSSDEHAECPGFHCADGIAVPDEFECDGVEDCFDGSDEHAGCPHVTCADGTTVPGERCDEVTNCSDASDEPATCPPSAEEQICGTR